MLHNQDKKVAQVLAWTLGLNLLVSLSKLVYGILTHSLSLEADGFHSLFDATSNVVGLVGLFFASRPPDDDHPYGHRKIETLASLFIALMLFFTCYEILSKLYARYQTPVIPHVDTISFVVMFVTLIINIFVARYESRKGKTLKSDLLLADSMHTKTDILVSLSVLVSFGAILMKVFVFDLVIAGFIVVVIVWAGFQILLRSLNTLLDAQHLDPRIIEKIVLAIPEIKGCHKIRSRGTPNRIFVDLHIHLDPLMTLEKAHHLTHVVIDAIKEQIPEVYDVLIHTEPAESFSSYKVMAR